jgi:hypothetical protein
MPHTVGRVLRCPRGRRSRPAGERDMVSEQAEDRAALREFARTTASSLRLRQGMGFDDWLSIGSQIARISNASAWWLGDWVVYGRRAYGDRYKRALEATELDYQTCGTTHG